MTTTDAVTLTEADERAIRTVVARADATQSDPVALPALHTPQGVLVNIAGRRVLGREAIAAAMTAALATPMRDVLTSVEVLDVRLTTPDVAVVSCVKTVHDQRKDADGPAFPATGALTYVLTRTGDTWQIALAQTTPIASA